MHAHCADGSVDLLGCEANACPWYASIMLANPNKHASIKAAYASAFILRAILSPSQYFPFDTPHVDFTSFRCMCLCIYNLHIHTQIEFQACSDCIKNVADELNFSKTTKLYVLLY